MTSALYFLCFTNILILIQDTLISQVKLKFYRNNYFEIDYQVLKEEIYTKARHTLTHTHAFGS